MLKMPTIVAIGVVAVVVTAISSLYVVGANTINVRRPESPVPTVTTGQPAPPRVLPVPPLMLPPNQPGMVPLRAGAAITPPDTRPIARIDPAPAGLTPVSATFPQGSPPPADTPAYTILSSVEYTLNGKAIYVTTARPNAAAAQRANLYGERTVTLGNGTTAFVVTNAPGPTANRVVFVKGDLVVTVASDLPIGEVQNLATRIAVK